MRGMSLLLALAVAAPLAAQQPDSAKKPAMPMGGHRGMMGPGMMQGDMQGMMGHMQMMQGMMGPMMHSMAYTPASLLMHKDQLKLTDQQVTRLTALRDAAKTAHDAAMNDMHTHMQEMLPLMDAATPDTAKIKPHFQAVQAAMAKAHWAMLVASAQARAVLNDAQRGWVEGWSDAMGHQGMMGQGGMMGRGMRMERGMMMRSPLRDSTPPQRF
jgi:Spy/CpxP family protein refolding chaperone